MFFSKKVWSAELLDSDRTGQGREISGRLSAYTVIFFVSWFVTYNKAYLTGDDVSTFKGSSYFRAFIFFPKLKHGWIPNRVVDMYGRNFLARVFDLIYFPAKSLFGVNFFFVFKIFNATVFAIFLCFVYRYLVDQIFTQELSLGEGTQKRGEDVLSSIFVAFLVLTFLPWTNEVQMVCYQIPAFLSFVVLAELFKRMPGFSVQVQPNVPLPWLMTLAFVAAFSLEAYSAIMLGAIVFAWLLNYPWFGAKAWRSHAFILSCFLAGYCLAALCVTALFAARPRAIESSSPPRKQIFEFLSASHSLSYDAKLYCGLLAVGILVPLLILVFQPFHQRLMQSDQTMVSGIAPALQRPLFLWIIFVFIVLFPTMIITSLASLKTGINYFSLNSYPWGGFLLIVGFFAILATAIPAVWCWEGDVYADMARNFLMMLFISWAAIQAMNGSSQYYENSLKVLNAYHAARRNLTPVFDTGLSLNAIPYQIRPLPTAQSKSGLIAEYRQFFKKYYEVNTKILFK
jgi:MFS family permease